jgi:ATP-dependent exoDNAse (exonuclease V) beta subunit
MATPADNAGEREMSAAQEHARGARGRAVARDKHDDSVAVGIVVHDVLSRLTPSRLANAKARQVAEWLARSAAAHEYDDPVGIERANKLLRKFVLSERARELAGALQFRTEVEFLLPWQVRRTAEDQCALGGQPEPRYLQGFLDLLYADRQENWWILDYKTNRVNAQNRAQLQTAYTPQMWIYALAVEQALGVEPAGMALHFLHDGSELRLEWNEAARGQARTWLDTALETALQAGL